MGSNREQKKTNRMLEENNRQNQAEHQKFNNEVQSDRDAARGRANDLWSTVSSGYKTFAGGGPSAPNGGSGGFSLAPETSAKLGKVGNFYNTLSDTGGVDAGRLRGGQPVYQDFMKSGGWDPEAVGRMRGDARDMRSISSDGNVASRMRGMGVFDEFAKTGGFSDDNIRDIRARSNSAIPSMYSTAMDEVNRQGSLSGISGPGQAALMARMGREAARDSAVNRRDTELGISDRVREGRMQGATQLAGAEGAYQGMRMGALQGAAGLEHGIESGLSANKLAGADRYTQSEQNTQDRILDGQKYGHAGLERMASDEESRGRASAAASAGDARFAAEWDRDNRMYGLGGLHKLYGDTPNELLSMYGVGLDGRRTNIAAQGQNVDQRMANNPQRDWMSTLAGLAGAAGGAMTGFGNLGYKPGGR